MPVANTMTPSEAADYEKRRARAEKVVKQRGYGWQSKIARALGGMNLATVNGHLSGRLKSAAILARIEQAIKDTQDEYELEQREKDEQRRR